MFNGRFRVIAVSDKANGNTLAIRDRRSLISLTKATGNVQSGRWTRSVQFLST